jgi:hypothetical protein
MKFTSLKTHLAAFFAATALAAQAHAQSSLINISAAGIYQGGNTVIGGIPFTNGSPFTEYFTLLIPDGGLPNGFSSPTNNYMSASEVMTIGVISYTNTQSSIDLTYHGSAGGTILQLEAGAVSDPSTFGFDIALNTNLFSGTTTSLTVSELGAIFSAFESNSPFLVWGSGKTDIYANQQDYGSTVGDIAPVPEPSTLALAAFAGAGAWMLLRRRRK